MAVGERCNSSSSASFRRVCFQDSLCTICDITPIDNCLRLPPCCGSLSGLMASWSGGWKHVRPRHTGHYRRWDRLHLHCLSVSVIQDIYTDIGKLVIREAREVKLHPMWTRQVLLALVRLLCTQ